MNPLKLLIEQPFEQDLEIIVEEQNTKSPKTLYIQGPFLMAEAPNLNKRVYALDEMVKEVDRYKTEYINQSRALGELGHPTGDGATEVNLSNAAHMIVNLEQKGNVFMGKSKLLSTPAGILAGKLIQDGCKLSVSSRALGSLNESEDGMKKVKNLHLICVDIVHTPSYKDAIQSSIWESKEYLIQEGGRIVEMACNELGCKLKTLPKHDVEKYIKESFETFIRSLKK